MNSVLRKITILGGGSAGWLSAGIIAAEHLVNEKSGIEVTLIESSDIAPLGVGEGTWPSMRATLKKMGISETEFILECDASFKQGSRFQAWINNHNDYYYHPFSLPVGHEKLDIAPFWLPYHEKISFADAVCVQSRLGDKNLAPKLISSGEYAFNANYAYHLDAGKFAVLLREHCVERLGVKHVVDHVTAVNSTSTGDIASLTTKENGDITGDLFIDCSGAASVLLGKHFKVPFLSKKDVLFNDTALAAQAPYDSPESPIASFTVSTAQTAGWIWDIGLQSRRGIGYTYSSAHTTDEQAENILRKYISPTPSMGVQNKDEILVRKLSFEPGHREQFWYKNCVAIGVSAGFIEPLEASALALIELSAKMVSDQLPADRRAMDIVARRFNEKFLYRWQKIVEFLKLHYVLSQRSDSDYWLDNRKLNTVPDSLQDMLALWRYQSPNKYDFPQLEELFPSASFQYVLYGMGFIPELPERVKRKDSRDLANKLIEENIQHTKQLMAVLPTNRGLVNKLKQYHRIGQAL